MTSRRRWALAMVLAPPLLAVTVFLLWWRGPDWSLVGNAFTVVAWWWVALAIALNLLSVIARAAAWRTVVRQALPDLHPPFGRVFSAFSVGLLGNAVLPGRIGEIARVAVLRRRLPRGRGVTPTLIGTVVAHRLFDLFPAMLLVAYVLATARIPHWAVTGVLVVAAAGVVLFAFALVATRLRPGAPLDGARPLRRLLTTIREGLSVLRTPVAAAGAIVFQCAGWLLQLLAVYVTMRAFGIDAPLPAAGLVLLLMNLATVFPLWPGNVGLLQAAVALPLVSYGVAATTGFAYGLGLQILEMSVGVGVGLLFLAREGLSFAMLREMPQRSEARASESPTPLDLDAARGAETQDPPAVRPRASETTGRASEG